MVRTKPFKICCSLICSGFEVPSAEFKNFQPQRLLVAIEYPQHHLCIQSIRLNRRFYAHLFRQD